MATWKKVERAVAKKLGGERIPVTGRIRGSAPDIAHPVYAVEVKHRKCLPSWIRTAMAQAEASKRPPQRVAIAVLHECSTRHDSDIVLMSLRDFVSWCGPIVAADPDCPTPKD